MVPVPDYPQVVVPYKKLRVLEKNRVLTFPEAVGEEVVSLDVVKLLNNVDGVRTSEAESPNLNSGSKTEIHFHGPTYGVAANLQGDQNIVPQHEEKSP